MKEIRLSEPDDIINGIGFVDLGLPSGTLWANCNMNASNPLDEGELILLDSSYETLQNLIRNGDERVINEINRLPTYVKNIYVKFPFLEEYVFPIELGNQTFKNWRLPDDENFIELSNECTNMVGELDGKKGIFFKGKNGKSIFLPYYQSNPIVGEFSHFGNDDINQWGRYLSSSGDLNIDNFPAPNTLGYWQHCAVITSNEDEAQSNQLKIRDIPEGSSSFTTKYMVRLVLRP